MPKESRAERFGREYYEHEKEASKGLADVYGTGYQGKKLTRAEEKLIWMARVDKDGKPGISDEEAQQWLAAGKSREEVGMHMFPQREPLAKSGGRVEPKDWITFANKISDDITQQEMAMQAANGAPEVSPYGSAPYGPEAARQLDLTPPVNGTAPPPMEQQP